MPTYNYKCSECEHEFEEVHRMSENKVPCEAPCPSCEAVDSVSQVITTGGTGFQADTPMRPDPIFRDIMKSVKKSNIGSNIPDY